MQKKRTIKENFFLLLKGLAMGGANKVPGVSGGMVAFVMGFYEELIFTFQRINLKSVKLLLNGRFKSFAVYTNLQFLIFVMSGSIFSYFSISLLLDYLIKNYELYVWSWFFGMIIGSIFYISKDFDKWNFNTVLALLLGIIVGLSISFLEPAKENHNLWFVFICGIIGVSGMTIPGLSGSFILILVGNYVLLLVDSVNVLSSVITNLVSGNFDILNDKIKIHYLKILAIFTTGSLFGLIFLSHILAYILKRWNSIVTAIIIGFIAGSLGIVWPWKKTIYKLKNGIFIKDIKCNKIIENYQRYIPDLTNYNSWIAILLIIVGFLLIISIYYYGKKNKK